MYHCDCRRCGEGIPAGLHPHVLYSPTPLHALGVIIIINETREIRRYYPDHQQTDAFAAATFRGVGYPIILQELRDA